MYWLYFLFRSAFSLLKYVFIVNWFCCSILVCDTLPATLSDRCQLILRQRCRRSATKRLFPLWSPLSWTSHACELPLMLEQPWWTLAKSARRTLFLSTCRMYVLERAPFKAVRRKFFFRSWRVWRRYSKLHLNSWCNADGNWFWNRFAFHPGNVFDGKR